MNQGDRPASSWATMNAPARALTVVAVATLTAVTVLLAALVIGGLAWLVQAVWGAVLA